MMLCVVLVVVCGLVWVVLVMRVFLFIDLLNLWLLVAIVEVGEVFFCCVNRSGFVCIVVGIVLNRF